MTHTPGKVQVFNVVHPDRGGAMTPDEIGKYIADAVRKTIAEGGGLTDRFLEISMADDPQLFLCHVGNGPAGLDNAQRIKALWNAAEELELTTEKIAEGVIQMTFAHNHERSATIEALLSRFQECMSEKIEAQRAAGRLKDQYENVSKHYSSRGEDIERLEAEKSEMVVALKTMVEMVEMNGFGKHYALDLAKAAIGREEK